jgi:hypothetical protein
MTVVRRIVVAVAGISTIACGSAAELTVPIGVPPHGVLTTDSIGYHARRSSGVGGEAIYDFGSSHDTKMPQAPWCTCNDVWWAVRR